MSPSSVRRDARLEHRASIPGRGLLQTLFPTHKCQPPAEEALRERDIRDMASDISRSIRPVLDDRLYVNDTRQLVDEVQHTNLAARRQVDRPAPRLIDLQEIQGEADRVANVDIVACLHAVAEDDD